MIVGDFDKSSELWTTPSVRVLCVFVIPTWALALQEGGSSEVHRQESLVANFLTQSTEGAVTARLARATLGCVLDSEGERDSLLDSIAGEYPLVYESESGRYHLDVLGKAVMFGDNDPASVRNALAEAAAESLWQELDGEDRYTGIPSESTVGLYLGGVKNLPTREYVGFFWKSGGPQTPFTIMARSLGEAEDMLRKRESGEGDLRVSIWNEEDASAKRPER